MKFKNVVFLKSCKKAADFPKYPYPEFAFLGRSNVGKSSLINMITGIKNLVKTGSRPGLTQLVNFFIADDKISIVDLPGYGYAKAPEEIRSSFMPMIKSYIAARENLKLAFLLIDIRRVPDEREKDILGLLANAKVPIAIIMTKCDKLSNNQIQSAIAKTTKFFEIEPDSVFITSAETQKGKKEILGLIFEFSKATDSNTPYSI